MPDERVSDVLRVCQEALGREGAARAAYLDAACGSDPVLRREVEALLAESSAGGSGFLETPPWAPAPPALAVGQRLGPYEVTGRLGAGGMGEVYRARDTRLDRTVAIKVLPAELSADPERRARFEREARVISALNHPHICTLHDIGQQDGTTYLVMEHLAGETLAERLKKGPLPLNQVLDLGAQIAEALDAAHRHGIVHRDLKPGNVMLTKSGAKLLDFGLAKLTGHGERPALVSEPSAATETESLTGRGAILGTLPYMAPEQLEGKATDARTDLWALGTILYEMVTGQRAFAAASSVSLIGQIMNAEPPALATRQPLTPQALDHVVRTCLAKDPDERWQAAADVGRELAWIATQTATIGVATPASPAGVTLRGTVRWALFASAAAAFGFAAAATLWVPGERSQGSASPVARVRIGAAFAPSSGFFVAVSPDGRVVAYVGQREGRQQIYLRRLDANEATPVPETEDGMFPFFSPDGRWLGFISSGSLKKVLLPGGPAESLISNLNALGGATWGRDNTIIVATDQRTMVLLRVPATGGSPERVMEADTKRGEWYLSSPLFLPDGRTLLVTASDGSCEGTRLVVQPLDGRPRRTLLERAADARYLLTGHLVFVREGDVLTAPFDATRTELLGPPVPLSERVHVDSCRFAALGVSDGGVLAYLPPSPSLGAPPYRPVWVDRRGQEMPTNVGLADEAGGVRISPDGKRVALMSGRSPSIAVIDLDRRVTTRLSTEGTGFWPIWSPDGRKVAFSLVLPGSTSANIHWRLADGSGRVQRLTSGDLTQNPRAFTPDGKVLIFHEGVDTNTGFDIAALPLEQGAAVQPLLHAEYHEYCPSLSPDGRWLAYVAEESGRPEIYVRPFPSLDARWQVSADGGLAPVWSRDGHEVFYQQGQMGGMPSRLFAVRIDTASGFRADVPRLLFEGPYVTAERYGQSYDVAPDGQRFLMVRVEHPAPPTEIRLVLNWFEELKAKVPTR